MEEEAKLVAQTRREVELEFARTRQTIAEAALAKFHADRKAANEAAQAKNLCAPALLAQRPLSRLVPACANGRWLNCHKRGFLLGRSDASFCVAGLQGG